MTVGPDQADIDYMPIGASEDYQLKPATYYVYVKSVGGTWFTTSSNTIPLTAGATWTVRYTAGGGNISQD